MRGTCRSLRPALELLRPRMPPTKSILLSVRGSSIPEHRRDEILLKYRNIERCDRVERIESAVLCGELVPLSTEVHSECVLILRLIRRLGRGFNGKAFAYFCYKSCPESDRFRVFYDSVVVHYRKLALREQRRGRS